MTLSGTTKEPGVEMPVGQIFEETLRFQVMETNGITGGKDLPLLENY